MEITDYGYGSWLELYRELVANNLAGEFRVSLVWPQKDDQGNAIEKRPSVTMYVRDIQAHAFAELYERLPERATVLVILELLNVTNFTEPATLITPQEREAIYSFLNKIPTK